MPSMLVPQRWTSQPQYPVGVDWSNPITRGLVFAWEGSLNRDLASGAIYNRSSDVVTSCGQNSRQVSMSQTGGFASDFGSSASFSNGATQTTAMLDIYFDSASPTGKPFCQWDGNFLWLIQLSNGNLVWIPAQDDTTARRRWDASGFITAAGWYRLVFSWRGGSDVSVYVNGLNKTPTLSVVNADANAVGTSSQILSLFQSGNLAGQISGFISGARLWRRGLSDAEIRSMSVNPWQIFSPRLT